MIQLAVPELGEGISEVEVVCWHRQEGDSIALDEDLVEIVTDKASFNISAPSAGKLKTIVVPAGKIARVGDVLGFIQ